METNSPVGEPKQKSKLPIALGLASLIAVSMTIISVAIYYFAGFYKLDLSRPGYEIEREDVFNSEGTQTYDSTSSLSAGAIDDILKEFDERNTSLDSYGDFNNDALSDENILLGR
ncbi:MAG TPA: hypothetical protein VLA77_01200 [Candidatus Saccharimonadales bacterium]|nr:hypothetical protein [Candidatus Saccharimonadales bacterium]